MRAANLEDGGIEVNGFNDDYSDISPQKEHILSIHEAYGGDHKVVSANNEALQSALEM